MRKENDNEEIKKGKTVLALVGYQPTQILQGFLRVNVLCGLSSVFVLEPSRFFLFNSKTSNY